MEAALYRGTDHDPEIARGRLVIMGAHGGAARHLIIDEQIAGIQLQDQILQQSLHPGFLHGHPDVQRLRAAEEAVDVLVDGEDMIIAAGTGVVDTVAEPADTVVHRDGHLFDRPICTVVISQSLHESIILSVVAGTDPLRSCGGRSRVDIAYS